MNGVETIMIVPNTNQAYVQPATHDPLLMERRGWPGVRLSELEALGHDAMTLALLMDEQDEQDNSVDKSARTALNGIAYLWQVDARRFYFDTDGAE